MWTAVDYSLCWASCFTTSQLMLDWLQGVALTVKRACTIVVVVSRKQSCSILYNYLRSSCTGMDSSALEYVLMSIAHVAISDLYFIGYYYLVSV